MPELRTSHCRVIATWIVAVCVCLVADGGEVRLKKSGFTIEGNPIAIQNLSPNRKTEMGLNNEVYPVTMIETAMVRYFIPTTNIDDINRDQVLGKYDVFKLKQALGARNRAAEHVGIPLKTTEFDERGHRTVSLQYERGPIDIQQVITEIGPQHCKVSCVGWAWDFSIATTSLRSDRLDQLIRSVTDQMKLEDRLTIARFYLQAGRYLEALKELDSIVKDFPEKQAQVNGFALEARQQLAAQLLEELEHRSSRGQHRVAYETAKSFPIDQMSAANLRRVREFLGTYDQARDDAERALMLLGELQGQVKDPQQRELLEAMRSEVSEQLSYETLPRLKPFLIRCEDAQGSADDKLALAYSGWLLGESKAIDRLDKVLAFWKARFLVLNSLREVDGQKRFQAVADLIKLEGVGPETILALLPNLPAILETPEAKPGQPALITADLAHADLPSDSPPVKYQVLLPQEYSPQHRYPLVISLRPIERNAEWSLRWWGGNSNEPLQAQRHGYIVMAPEYLVPGEKNYTPNARSHFVVLQAIRDARKRFNIDSDRIFLAGHGTGGDAAFDIGLSHPDEFAGVIPITGIIPDLTRHLSRNAKWTGLYVITGELDRNTFEANSMTINRWMIAGSDVVLAEYIGRGYESYYGEIHKLFAWMELRQRPQLPKEFFIESMRPNDNRFFWVKGQTLPPDPRPLPTRLTSKTTPKPPSQPPVQDRATALNVTIRDGRQDVNELRIVVSTAKQHKIWLSPELLSFDKRLHVWVGSVRKFNDFIEPNTEAILEDFRARADRQRIFQAKLDLN